MDRPKYIHLLNATFQPLPQYAESVARMAFPVARKKRCLQARLQKTPPQPVKR